MLCIACKSGTDPDSNLTGSDFNNIWQSSLITGSLGYCKRYKAAMSNPRPSGRVRPSRRFCAAHFRFSL